MVYLADTQKYYAAQVDYNIYILFVFLFMYV